MNEKNPRQKPGTATPATPAEHLIDEQKKALELGEEMDHAHGRKREELEHEIERAAGKTNEN